MTDPTIIFAIFIIAVALIFDFTNGAHDAANSIATVVSTRVLSLGQALVYAALCNFFAFLIFGTEVAKTIGKGLVDINVVTLTVIFAGLVGAILWNLLTLYLALPTSSSHALIGGYAGAAITKAGFGVILIAGWTKTLIFIVMAPLIGMILGYLMIIGITWLIHLMRFTPTETNLWARRLQLVSAGLYSLGHGSNDAQKTVGIITGVLFSAKMIDSFTIPMWVIFAAYGTIALGTLWGGKRIIKTMGQKIYHLRAIDGLSAETASAISIFTATHLGVPVSTTHVITGAISGVGSAYRLSAVKWDVTLRIVWAWFLTIPCAGILAAVIYSLLEVF